MNNCVCVVAAPKDLIFCGCFLYFHLFSVLFLCFLCPFFLELSLLVYPFCRGFFFPLLVCDGVNCCVFTFHVNKVVRTTIQPIWVICSQWMSVSGLSKYTKRTSNSFWRIVRTDETKRINEQIHILVEVCENGTKSERENIEK